MRGYSDLSIHPRVGLFAYVPEREWRSICAAGISVQFQPSSVLLRQGDPTEHVHVIVAGCVKATRCEVDGSQALLTLRAAGDVVGDMSAVDRRPRSATVTALTEVITYWLSGEQFRRFLARPAMAAGFAAYTVGRLRESDRQRTEMAVLPVRQRLARTLMRLNREGSRASGRLPIRLPQRELAELIGASRNAVVAELAALRAQGIVVTRRRETEVVDLERLARLADEPRVD
ncbi:Crp/Fnr family transcriptional regulator [Actinoplanes cyaneus]|uniref:Crp/Fnr family transcriptional regulator n=1 Tax=Actinoplanes cyaneus TaxID=52696 RepID=A0A919IN10_9ACTN|nr:Crp/Fnr family transcriptional regulator [Actinoplanes cyaneus]MCW2141592.1 cAMP-binding domain of CRP or a regulatory subunit of cAMP-dependent protein kinases [Actinoplanes cyaneus]GID68328.1 Crp/Fnr family transcriptional regulator [Actinoplanes cyaneus]